MKKSIFLLLAVFFAQFFFSGCAIFETNHSGHPVEAGKGRLAEAKHEPITEQLIVMVEHTPELKRMLLHSIERARTTNPDKRTNPAQTIEEYYAFVDWAAKAMPWNILRNTPYSNPSFHE